VTLLIMHDISPPTHLILQTLYIAELRTHPAEQRVSTANMLGLYKRTSSCLLGLHRQAIVAAADHHQPSTSFSCRNYASDESASTDSIGNENVQRLAKEIMGLTVLESSWLSEILRKRLNIAKPTFGGMPMMGAMSMMPASPVPVAAAAAAATEAAPVEKKEKTEFEVKLASFTPEGKIKVIKEIRAITGLGLKEAKELVSRCFNDGLHIACMVRGATSSHPFLRRLRRLQCQSRPTSPRQRLRPSRSR